MNHLRYAGLSEAEQRGALEEIIRAQPVLMGLLTDLRDFALPDWMLVSGAIYNNVWNHLTGRPFMHGVRDFDVFYFDDTDLSYEAEDFAIQRAAQHFGHLTAPVEVRNQARVHLWFEKKFGQPFSPLKSSAEMLRRFASKTHAVGVRLDLKGRLEIEAPFGLDPMFSFQIVPNHVLENRSAHIAKANRALAHWPELVVENW